jgi:hypothetical protein
MSLILENKSDSIIINRDNLFISSDEWKNLNFLYSKEDIKNAISSAIEEYNISVPKDNITVEEAQQDFDKLRKLNTSDLIKKGKTFTRYDYKWELSDTYIDACNIGNKSSNLYHQDSRYICDSINSPSPNRSWYIKKFRDTLLNCLWTLKFEHIDLKNLKVGLHLRKYIASQFRPSAAKAIYKYFDSKDVLDFSTGWGDRLNGFLSCEDTKSYFGIDPNKSLYDGYERQLKAYNSNKVVNLNCSCAEDIQIYNKFDTIFTSPPYFNIERYTQEDNQSWKRYKKLDDWLNKFLFVVISKSWNSLKPNGVMIINISDVYSNHTINKICDPMNDYISTLAGAKYEKTIGLRMAKRPNSKASVKEGVFTEPMWIWRKE